MLGKTFIEVTSENLGLIILIMTGIIVLIVYGLVRIMLWRRSKRNKSIDTSLSDKVVNKDVKPPVSKPLLVTPVQNNVPLVKVSQPEKDKTTSKSRSKNDATTIIISVTDNTKLEEESYIKGLRPPKDSIDETGSIESVKSAKSYSLPS